MTDAPEERDDAQEISRAGATGDARALLRRNKNGVLATVSKRLGGYPFGSIAPFALDARGEPILFTSTIAEHTKNFEADPRASLLIQEEAKDDDAQAHGRITLVGRVARVEGEALADAR